MRHQGLSRAIVLALSGAACWGLPPSAYSESSTREAVTGSRLRLQQDSHRLWVIDRDRIERSGHVVVGDLLQDLPISGAALNTQFNNGGTGETRLDLRNLGENRVLVLMNGRRLTPDLEGRVDLNNIPLAVVDRIEILRGSASAIYGSDAISGVVNVITRDDFEGMQANAQQGQFESDNDGEIQAYDFSIGTTSDRGSVFFNASYVQQDEVMAGDRSISFEPLFGTGVSFGSSATPQGRFFGNFSGLTFLTTDLGTQVDGPEDFKPFVFANDGFNFAPDNYLVTPYERTSVFSQATYDLTDDIRLQAEMTYVKQLNRRQLAPTPLTFGGLLGPGASDFGVGVDNPFNPFGADLNDSAALFERRMVEAGPRFTDRDLDSFRFAVGLDGRFEWLSREFEWDISALHGRNDRSDRIGGRFNLDRIQQALSSECPLTSGCVPLNLFGGPGTISQEMVDFIGFEANEFTESRLRGYSAGIQVDWLELPAGPLGIAAGFNYFRHQGDYLPDALVRSGNTTVRRPLIVGGIQAAEEFHVELAVPLLSGKPGADRLDFSIAARHSDYDSFGDITPVQASLAWRPVEAVSVRATYAEGFRAPQVAELFGESGQSFPTLTDLCSDILGLFGGTPAPPPLAANCIATGVPADGSYVQNNAQILVRTGPNPNLGPETGETLSVDVLWAPKDSLSIGLHAYEIEIDQMVTTFGAQTILNRCLGVGNGRTTSNPGPPDPRFCTNFTRGITGIITSFFNGLNNGEGLRTKGVDFSLDLTLPQSSWGRFAVRWDSAYSSSHTSRPGASNRQINILGFDIGDETHARWKSQLGVNWSWGDWEADYGIQYLHGVEEACFPGLNDPSFTVHYCTHDSNGDGNVDRREIGGTAYHDLQVSYQLEQYDTRLTFGVQNLWDKGPPLSTQAFANSFNSADHRTPGRFPYLRLSVDF